MFCGILIVDRVRGKVCDIEKALLQETLQGRCSIDDGCEAFMIKQYSSKKQLYCLDLCNLHWNCKSLNYNIKTQQCILFSLTITEMLQERCLQTNDRNAAGISTEVVIDGNQIDVNKLDLNKVCIEQILIRK